MGHGKCQTDEELDAVLEKVEALLPKASPERPSAGGGPMARRARAPGAARGGEGGTHDGQRRTGLHARGARPLHRRSARRRAARRPPQRPSAVVRGARQRFDLRTQRPVIVGRRYIEVYRRTAAAHDAARDTNLCRRRSERLRRLGVGGGSAAASTRGGGGGGGTSASSAFPIGGDGGGASGISTFSPSAASRTLSSNVERGRSARGRAPGGGRRRPWRGARSGRWGTCAPSRATASGTRRAPCGRTAARGATRRRQSRRGRSRSSARRTRAARSAP